MEHHGECNRSCESTQVKNLSGVISNSVPSSWLSWCGGVSKFLNPLPLKGRRLFVLFRPLQNHWLLFCPCSSHWRQSTETQTFKTTTKKSSPGEFCMPLSYNVHNCPVIKESTKYLFLHALTYCIWEALAYITSDTFFSIVHACIA